MGTCITVIKVVGAGSLGLLTGNLAYQSYKKIPELIRQLNTQVSISSTSAASLLQSITQNVCVSSAANVIFASLTTYLFSTAYKYSPPSGKHPYLLYCAVGAPLALASYFLSARSADIKIVQSFREKKKAAAKKPVAAEVVPEASPVAPVDSDDSSLAKSYIRVSDSSSSSSTPLSSVPSSPEQPAAEIQPTTSTIEQEVDDALNKKEYIHHLETVQSSCKAAFAVSGAAFVVSAIGLLGDLYFI